jgi:hypothetical protein
MLVQSHVCHIGQGSHRPSRKIQDLRISVRKLRQKVEADPTQPLLIVGESGVGYRLEQGDAPTTQRHRGTSSDTYCT